MEIKGEHRSRKKPKALFIVGSSPRAEMFDSVRRLLREWDILALNVNTSTKWYKEQTERVLQELNFPYKTVGSFYGEKAKNIIRT